MNLLFFQNYLNKSKSEQELSGVTGNVKEHSFMKLLTQKQS